MLSPIKVSRDLGFECKYWHARLKRLKDWNSYHGTSWSDQCSLRLWIWRFSKSHLIGHFKICKDVCENIWLSIYNDLTSHWHCALVSCTPSQSTGLGYFRMCAVLGAISSWWLRLLLEFCIHSFRFWTAHLGFPKLASSVSATRHLLDVSAPGHSL